MASVTVRIDEKALRNLNNRDQMVDRAVSKAAGKVRDNAKVIIRNERRGGTGAMRNGITKELWRNNTDGVFYEVASRQFYSRWQHDGTTGPIYPRRAKVLRFQINGRGKFIYAKKVRGITGIKFLERAKRQLKPSDYT